MVRILLAAINAKYIHSNLGIYSLRTYAQTYLENIKKEECSGSDWDKEEQNVEILIGEYTINQQIGHILKDIYEKQPDMVGFSCYIWNISMVLELVHDLHKVLPNTDIWLGGPEVSYDAARILREEPEVCGVMCNEGEETFARLSRVYQIYGRNGIQNECIEINQKEKCQDVGSMEQTSASVRLPLNGKKEALYSIEKISGIVCRRENGEVMENAPSDCLNMDKIPFSYSTLKGMEHRIIYYESSRGCPFSCSYCLSSIDKRVRFRSLDLVLKELDFFLEKKVPQVKFVDRTFNCRKSHAMAIWKHILEHDNQITNFHFEISADLLDEEELDLLQQMRPGLIQLEIGVQSTNPDTIREIHRSMNLERLREVVERINSFHNIHQHLDLIAGLPFEDIKSFSKSFDDVYKMEPEQLQLGFLKVLKGSFMMENREQYALLYQEKPPYEVLSTKWISYQDILRLKGIEDMVEVYYNSRQFENTIKQLEKYFQGPFAMYDALASFYCEEKLTELNHSRLERYEILYQFICRKTMKEEWSMFRDQLMLDLYLRENAKSRPSFAPENGKRKKEIRNFFQQEAKEFRYLKGYEGFDSKQLAKMAHIEVMENGKALLFDYKNRDALTYNALCWDITDDLNQMSEE